jgi:hypothetical protein
LELSLSHEYEVDKKLLAKHESFHEPIGISVINFEGRRVREEDLQDLARYQRSDCAFHVLTYLNSLPKISHYCDHSDQGLLVYAVDPVPEVISICELEHVLYMDEEFLAGPAVAMPEQPTADNNFSDLTSLRSFNRLSNVYDTDMQIFQHNNSESPMWDNIIQHEKHSGITFCSAAMGAVSCLYAGSHIKSLVSPNEINPFGVYSLKVFVDTIDRSAPPNEDGSQPVITVNGWIIIDDFVPCRADGKPIFSCCRPGGHVVWPVLIEKAIAKFYGVSTGGYNQLVRRPEYTAEIMHMLTGEPAAAYDLNKGKVWKTVVNMLSAGPKCRMAATAITNNRLTTKDAKGIVNGKGEHCYAVIDAAEVKDKFNKTVQLLRLRNTCKPRSTQFT